MPESLDMPAPVKTTTRRAERKIFAASEQQCSQKHSYNSRACTHTHTHARTHAHKNYAHEIYLAFLPPALAARHSCSNTQVL